MTEYHVLSLGAGVQSTALYLTFARGEMPAKLDAAIFADTQEEPAAVYRHLAWLRSPGGPPILTGTLGKLGDDLLAAGFTARSHRRRCYVLPRDTYALAQTRLRRMLAIGFTPMAMLWQPETPSAQKHRPGPAWPRFQRRWARPAIIRAREAA